MKKMVAVSMNMAKNSCDLLLALSEIDNLNIAKEIRTALDEYITKRMRNKDVANKVAKIKKRRAARTRELEKLLKPR